MMTEQPTQPKYARGRLFSHFNEVDESLHGSKWDELWKEDFAPWDNGLPNPALVDLLNERQDMFEVHPQGRKRKALVPGCGRGYDVLLLAAHGYDAYGLDVSERALENAKEVEKDIEGKEVYEARPGVEKGSITWLVADFFKNDFQRDLEGDGTFDLIYDYTFLSALPPSMRPAWSKRMAELLAPGGRLICLEWPTEKRPSDGGPPWALPSKIYRSHLQHPGEILPYDEDGDLQEADVGKQSTPDGLVSVAHLQPKRSFQRMGYNSEGKITDWISVWAHQKS